MHRLPTTPFKNQRFIPVDKLRGDTRNVSVCTALGPGVDKRWVFRGFTHGSSGSSLEVDYVRAHFDDLKTGKRISVPASMSTRRDLFDQLRKEANRCTEEGKAKAAARPRLFRERN